MYKILILTILLNSLAFSQNFISVYYLKPETQIVEGFGTADISELPKYNIPLNGFSLSWNHSLFKTEWLLLKAGAKFSYAAGSFFTDSRSIESRTDIYTGEAEISLELNKFKLKPFFSIGAGYENYRRDITLKPEVIYIAIPLPFKEECYPYSISAGVEYQFIDFLSAVINYNVRYTNYNLAEHKLSDVWGLNMDNQRESISVGITFVF